MGNLFCLPNKRGEESTRKRNHLLAQNKKKKSFSYHQESLNLNWEPTKESKWQPLQIPSNDGKQGQGGLDYFSLKDTLQTNQKILCLSGLCSIDNSRIVSLGLDGLITINDINKGKPLELKHYQLINKERLPTESNDFQETLTNYIDRAFSAQIEEKSLLFIGTFDGNIDIWSCDSNFQLLNSYKNHESCLLSQIYIPQLKAMATVGTDNKLLIWNPLTLETLFSNEFQEKEAPFSTCFRKNGTQIQIVVGLSTGEIRIFDLNNGKMTQAISAQGHKKEVISLAYGSKNDWLVSGAHDEAIKIWEVNLENELKCLKEVFEPQIGFRNFFIFEDKDLLVVNCSQDLIKIWNLSEGKKLGELEDETFGKAMTILGDHKYLISGVSYHGAVKIWELK